MITDEQREKWRNLAEAATPGPWEDNWNVDYHENIKFTRYSAWGEGPLTSGTSLGAVKPQAQNDARFIAASRAAVPALLDENADLRRQLEQATLGWNGAKWACDWLHGEMERLGISVPLEAPGEIMARNDRAEKAEQQAAEYRDALAVAREYAASHELHALEQQLHNALSGEKGGQQ